MACVATMEVVPPLNGERRGSWFSDWLPSWKPTSESQLEEAERTILSSLSSEYKDLYVPVGPNAVIRSILLEPEQPSAEEKTPLVLVHGFGCGIVQFYKNLDHLHSDRRLYALDLPGFARSTRIPFPADAEGAECAFVEALERWREGVGLERFILLGHSLGAFLSLAYSMKYPSRVRHLILNDPWGFPVRSPSSTSSESSDSAAAASASTYPNSQPSSSSSSSSNGPPLWVKVGAMFMSKFNPLSPIRAAGPLGPYLMSRFRPDLAQRFGEDFMRYIYHCAAQDPTGETAFYHMQIPIGWAKRPMIKRIGPDLDPSIPLTLIYGARSWMDNSTGEKIRELRPHSYLCIHYVRRAGHHVHADQPEAFNSVVKEVCFLVDQNEDIEPGPHSIPETGITPEQSQ